MNCACYLSSEPIELNDSTTSAPPALPNTTSEGPTSSTESPDEQILSSTASTGQALTTMYFCFVCVIIISCVPCMLLLLCWTLVILHNYLQSLKLKREIHHVRNILQMLTVASAACTGLKNSICSNTLRFLAR